MKKRYKKLRKLFLIKCWKRPIVSNGDPPFKKFWIWLRDNFYLGICNLVFSAILPVQNIFILLAADLLVLNFSPTILGDAADHKSFGINIQRGQLTVASCLFSKTCFLGFAHLPGLLEDF